MYTVPNRLQHTIGALVLVPWPPLELCLSPDLHSLPQVLLLRGGLLPLTEEQLALGEAGRARGGGALDLEAPCFSCSVSALGPSSFSSVCDAFVGSSGLGPWW